METANLDNEVMDTITDEEIDKTLSSKVYCANCTHCVLIRKFMGKNEQYTLRVKCMQGKWRKKLGDEKTYKFFSVGRRTMDECELYEPMGELKQYLKDLRKSLPVKDEMYESNK